MPRIALLALLVGGCAGVAHAPAATPRPVAQRISTPSASGTWDWVFRSTDDQGDMRVEQEEWHLTQRGARIEGYYDRAVTMVSVDERLFRCNQRLGFTKSTRVRVAGQIEGDRVLLREVGFEAKPGPCDDGARNLVAYVGTLRTATLALRWGPEAGQTLVRRMDGAHAPLAQLGEGGPVGGDVQHASLSESVPLSGTWEWQLRSIDAEGDERIEHEEWHLTETADGITGYYDRTVSRTRGDGTFSCNNDISFETITRYTITGQRFGDKLTLTETDYKSTRGPCDNALRRLDAYQGHLADGESLILSWGPGNQLLHRKQ